MQQFQTLNRQQQPFIQSGYGAMGKLNTLLGIGSRPMPVPRGVGGVPGAPPSFGPTNSAMPVNGMERISRPMSAPKMPMSGNTRLNQLLQLRAMNGDTEAARMLGLF